MKYCSIFGTFVQHLLGQVNEYETCVWFGLMLHKYYHIQYIKILCWVTMKASPDVQKFTKRWVSSKYPKMTSFFRS